MKRLWIYVRQKLDNVALKQIVFKTNFIGYRPCEILVNSYSSFLLGGRSGFRLILTAAPIFLKSQCASLCEQLGACDQYY